MTEWSVFLMIGELVGFVMLVVKPLVNLTTTITKLNVTVENLSKMVDEQKNSSKRTHERLWKHNEEQDKIIDRHEIRITKLEEK